MSNQYSIGVIVGSLRADSYNLTVAKVLPSCSQQTLPLSLSTSVTYLSTTKMQTKVCQLWSQILNRRLKLVTELFLLPQNITAQSLAC